MSQDEREIRAFEAIIVSQLHRERDPMYLNDLPELTEGQKAALKARPNDFVEKLWAEVENEDEDEECVDGETCDVEAAEEFAAMNRAEEMDEETRKALDDARKEVLESMKKQKKEQRGANG